MSAFGVGELTPVRWVHAQTSEIIAIDRNRIAPDSVTQPRHRPADTPAKPAVLRPRAKENHVFCETRMSTIGGPGGIGGPKGPKGPDGPDASDAPDSSAGPDKLSGGRGPDAASATAATGQADIDAIAADIAAGKLTPREAVDKLVDQIAGTDVLDPADRAELREMMADLVANDPHLQGLLGRI